VTPGPKVAGAAGVLAGFALVGEFGFFMASGWSPEKFSDPAAALALLRDGGDALRVAGLLGMTGLALTALFVAGLAEKLRGPAPSRASATLYLGIVGITGHALVPLSLWLGVPAFLALDQSSALASWGAFAALLDGAQGVGNLFVGLSVIAAGSAILARDDLPSLLGWVALTAGLATTLTVLAADTVVAPLAGALFLPSLLLTVVFRIWAGGVLLQQATVGTASGRVPSQT
jgi:hypothetical protein